MPKRITELAEKDRPREKLLEKGADALSDIELLAILLGSGIKGKDVLKVARTLRQRLDKNKENLNVKTLTSIQGIGFAKACQLVAAIEFARRRLLNDLIVVQKAEDVLPLISYIADKKQEYFLCVSLNGANEVVSHRVVTVGLLDRNQVHPREVFVDAIVDRAASVILAHNHPSGALKPSTDDIATTMQLIEAGKILGIPVLDHIIISKKGYVSFMEE